MKIWALRLYSVVFVSVFAFAGNNSGDLVYSSDTIVRGSFINSGKIIVNNGVKVTYESYIDNRGHYENNGEITNLDNDGIVFSNVSGATFINNGKMKVSQFSNRSTATFYSDASSYSYAGMSGNFRNIGGGTFSIIGATLTGNFELDDIYNWKGEVVVAETNTLIFGICDSVKCGTKMGQISGNLTNKGQKGAVNVNIAHMEYGQKYTIITGTILGLDSDKVTFVGANLESVNAYYNNGVVWVEKKSTEPIKPDPSPDNPNPPPPTDNSFP